MRQKFKRLIALGLGVCLCATMLAGCGSGKNADTEVASTQVTTEAEATIEVGSKQMGSVGEITTFSLPDGPEDSEIYVEPIPDISDDFIRGMDASSVLVEENSGVKYYNEDGEEQDVFMTLAQAGINYIRIRVWNDPYDEDGNGYGGGNNDLATAIELGKRATMYGMKVCIDFHYSDFWSDPTRQYAPKAWEGMSIEERGDALYEYTIDSLTQLLDAGVDVGMVQIGNEINNGMSGVVGMSNVTKLLLRGSQAVREISAIYDHDIEIAVHLTNITDQAELSRDAATFERYDLDYDIFGLSYYPFWDGTNENMQQVAQMIENDYGKKVMIAETSYCYTDEDGDGSSNSFDGVTGLVDGYPATVQGQASMIRDICAAANEADVIGVFYWEGVWIPVGDPEEEDLSSIWEEYGSGWASSYASDYDPDQAGKYYGGCSWDNQAMFDFTGHPLASLNVWRELKYGTNTELSVAYVEDSTVSVGIGEQFEMPDTVNVVYNDNSQEAMAVTWSDSDIAAVDTNVGGNYTVSGTLEDGTAVECTVAVVMENLVLNPGFEDSDTSMWTVTYEGDTDPTDFQDNENDAYSGNMAFHFFSADSDMDFSIEQTFTDLEPGTYQLLAYSQGGDFDDTAEMELYAITSDGELTEPFMLTSWVDWKTPTITGIKITDGNLTIGIHIKGNAASWGTVDDFTLNRVSD